MRESKIYTDPKEVCKYRKKVEEGISTIKSEIGLLSEYGSLPPISREEMGRRELTLGLPTLRDVAELEDKVGRSYVTRFVPRDSGIVMRRSPGDLGDGRLEKVRVGPATAAYDEKIYIAGSGTPVVPAEIKGEAIEISRVISALVSKGRVTVEEMSDRECLTERLEEAVSLLRRYDGILSGFEEAGK